MLEIKIIIQILKEFRNNNINFDTISILIWVFLQFLFRSQEHIRILLNQYKKIDSSHSLFSLHMINFGANVLCRSNIWKG